jgi:hypothetical protein
MEEGDFLYIPNGVVHMAETIPPLSGDGKGGSNAGKISMHLSIGMYVENAAQGPYEAVEKGSDGVEDVGEGKAAWTLLLQSAVWLMAHEAEAVNFRKAVPPYCYLGAEDEAEQDQDDWARCVDYYQLLVAHFAKHANYEMAAEEMANLRKVEDGVGDGDQVPSASPLGPFLGAAWQDALHETVQLMMAPAKGVPPPAEGQDKRNKKMFRQLLSRLAVSIIAHLNSYRWW